MARKYKPVIKNYGLQYILSGLRAVLKDKNAPAWIKVAAADRLATISQVYDIELSPITPRPYKAPAGPVLEAEPVQEEVIEETLEDKKLLDEFNSKYLTKGESDELSKGK